MNQKYERERQEADFFDEVPHELDYPPEKERAYRFRTAAEPGVSPRLFIFGCVGVVILFGLMAFFFSEKSEVSKNDLTLLKKSLDRIETRLGEMDILNKRMDGLEKEVKHLRASVGNAVANIEKGRETPTAAKVETEYYTVRSGDSLYNIAKKHGLTVDRLTQLNQLNPKKPIQPGQQLVVSP
ncbi:MAG: LysM peptidoglycan-binding domain-containing protein [Deltaproteobacteria bacterium]|nr:LysM peptidoglycan-binding domain-containing protein [Deltaproteobacteria bacterium]